MGGPMLLIARPKELATLLDYDANPKRRRGKWRRQDQGRPSLTPRVGVASFFERA
jgi:hypothetical protein